ncbi:MAG: ribonuclease III [Paracoccaceae bacterium]
MKLNSSQKELCKNIDYSFQNLKLLEQALIHSSLKSKVFDNNQRMEFLGDRILGFVISDYLFYNYPKWREGDLALNYNSLVCKEACSEIAEDIGLGRSLIMGKSESKHGGRLKKAILADALEALICAVYLDSDLNTVKKLILKLWVLKLKNVGDIELDPKTALQQWIQSKGGGLPNYTDLKREGLDHDPIFHVEVRLENGLTAIGNSSSKRKAQQNAAQRLLSEIKKNNA